MQVASPAHRVTLALLLIATVYQASYAETKESETSLHADKLPLLEDMLATAMKHNPNVRAAQAELGRARLQAVKAIWTFRDEWQTH